MIAWRYSSSAATPNTSPTARATATASCHRRCRLLFMVASLAAATLVLVMLPFRKYTQPELGSIYRKKGFIAASFDSTSVNNDDGGLLAHYARPGYIQSRKYVVYTLYGDRAMDLEGALFNARSIPLYYLSWKALFVVDRTVPEHVLRQLHESGADIHILDDEYSQWGEARRIFRYLMLADPSMEYYMFRDTDSRVSAREISSVSTWLQSTKSYHIMRDYPTHGFIILGGMWGVHGPTIRRQLGDITASIRQFIIPKLPKTTKFDDQSWLEQFVYPRIGDDVIEHDAWHCVPSNSSRPFPLPRDFHGDYVGHILDPHATETQGIITALWTEYRKIGEQRFGVQVPEHWRLQPNYIYG